MDKQQYDIRFQAPFTMQLRKGIKLRGITFIEDKAHQIWSHTGRNSDKKKYEQSISLTRTQINRNT